MRSPSSSRGLCLAAMLSLVAAGAAAGPAFPARKPGLWEIRSVSEGAQAQKGKDLLVTQCTDAATDKALQEYGMSQPKMNRKFCKEEMRNEAGKMLVHTEVCKRSDSTITRRIVISGDFNSAYRLQSHTSYDPPPRTPPPNEDIVAEMRWLGACPADMKPGDMVMPGGMKMNVLDLTAAGAMAGRTLRTGPDSRPGEMTLPDGTKVDMEAMNRMAAEMQKRMPAGASGK